MAQQPLNLADIQQNQAIVDGDNRPTGWFVRLFNNNNRLLKSIINQIIAIPAIEQALIDLDAATAAAQAAADAATTAAGNAQGAADAAQQQTDLANSYVDANPLSASDAGSDATISIAAHSRIYGGGASVAVDAGSVTGLAYSTTYWVYYDDPARAGGAVVYQVTTSETVAAQTGDRHVVGAARTPAALAPPNTGAPVRPPGAGTVNDIP